MVGIVTFSFLAQSKDDFIENTDDVRIHDVGERIAADETLKADRGWVVTFRFRVRGLALY